MSGPAADLAMRARIDDYLDKGAGNYMVNGIEVRVVPFCRMSRGAGRPRVESGRCSP